MELMTARRRLLAQNPLKEYEALGNPAVFETNVAKPLKKLLIPFTPVQEGTGDPSPSNVRAITGWTGVNVTRTGKNLLPVDLSKWSTTNIQKYNAHIDNDGYLVITADKNYELLTVDIYGGYKNFTGIYLTQGEQYYLSVFGDTTSGVLRDNNGTNIGYSNGTSFNGGFNVGQIFVNIPNVISDETYRIGFQLETGSQTSYEKHKEVKVSVDWTNEAGTVYGGELDLVTGLLTADWVIHDLSELSITAPSSQNEPWNHIFTIRGIWDSTIQGYDKANGEKNIICEVARLRNGSEQFGNGVMTGTSNSSVMYLYDDQISTVSDFQTKYAGKYICYECAKKNTHQLSPTQITTLLGTNTIWSDTNGQNQIKYLKK